MKKAHTPKVSPKVWAIHGAMAQDEADVYLRHLLNYSGGDFPLLRTRLCGRASDLAQIFATLARRERVGRAKFRPGLIAELAVSYVKFALSQSSELTAKLHAIRAQERASATQGV